MAYVRGAVKNSSSSAQRIWLKAKVAAVGKNIVILYVCSKNYAALDVSVREKRVRKIAV